MNPGTEADAARDGVAPLPTTEGGAGATAQEPAGEEPGLPLRELDRALAPVRRMVAWALTSAGERHARLLGTNLSPHVARARALELPQALAEPLGALGALVGALDAPTAEERRPALSEAFALLSRVDALAGLPLRARLRPIPKVRQEDRPEEPARGEPVVATATVVRGAEPGRSAPTPRGTAPSVEEARPRPADRAGEALPGAEPASSGPGPARAVSPSPVSDEEEEEEAPTEFAGDLGHLLAEVVGCPPQVATALAAAGIETVRDLGWCRPSRIEVLEPVHGAGRDLPEPSQGGSEPVRAAVGGRIAGRWTVLRADGARERWSRLVGAGPLAVRWGEPVPEIEPGRKVVVAGTVTSDPRTGGRVLVDAEVVQADGQLVRLAGWGLADVDDRTMRALWHALSPALDQVRDPLPPEALRRVPGGLPELGPALLQAQVLCTETGRRRMAFDEAVIVQIGGILPRFQPGRDRGVAHTILHEHVARLGQTLELHLGDSAQAAFEDIKRDLRRNVPMRRLLVSEVGAGKGLVALLAAVTAAEAKSQVLVVGADATDAENRFLHADPLLREVGLVGRLIGATAGAAQRDAIRRGEVHVAFCTPDLLEGEALEFRRLGLVIGFEREAFGRVPAWHAALATAPRPHLLVVPGVPVGPRVLTTAYADLHVSLVRDEQRRPARISLCRATERVHAYLRVREAVERGDQGVVVFPMVDGRDAVEIPEALRLVRALESDALRGLKVTLLHGAMPREEQARVHEDFSHRRIQVLVATTRIEDAPTAPGASIVVIEQADRVEQWRLHRIIGYFSRSSRPAEAVLVVGETAEADAAARIDRVVSAPDGFQLTESLVQLRGVDRCVHAASAPAPSWRWFEPDRDLDLLLAARDEAHQALRQDPGLRRAGHAELAQVLRARWDLIWPDASERGWACLLREDVGTELRRKRRRRRRRR